MSVNLSMFAGAGAQLFDANGTPLSGGKLYSYTAGTTTPLATYTTSAGNVAHTNPIILDSAGRVPNGGEIWLTNNLNYKFVVRSSTDVLIATYDNISGNVGYVTLTSLGIPSVTNYGAVGDGVTDDTAAITAALATGQAMFFPEPSAFYKLTAPLNIAVPFQAGLYKVFDSSAVVTFAAGTVTYVHPEWFGADPTGVADSKAAVDRAIRSAYGDARLPVYFNGQYLINSEIELSSVYGVRLVSDRIATLDGKNIDNFQGIIKILNCQDVVIDGLRFAGDSSNSASATQGGIEIDNESPAVATGSSFITVQNCVFDKLRTFNLYGRIGQGSAQSKWTFRNNTFYLVGYAGSPSIPGVGGGIDIYSLFDIDTYVYNELTITGNIFWITSGYEGVAFKVQGARNSVVSNNIVNAGTVVDYGSALVELYMKDSTFSNNVINTTNTATYGLRSKGCINTTISNNRISTNIDIREAYNLTDPAGTPIARMSSRDLVLDNNQVDGYGSSVSQISNANGLTIQDCIFDQDVVMGQTVQSVYAVLPTFQNVTVLESAANYWNFTGAYPVTGTVTFRQTTGKFDSSYPPVTNIPVSATTDLTATLAQSNTATYTPAGTSNLALFSVPAAGTRITIFIVTSGTSSYTVRFTQGFGYVAPLSTGTTSGAVFVYDFVSNGTVLQLASSSNNTDLATIGPELITNGDFSSAVGWTVGSGWSIGSGVLTGATASTTTYQAVLTSGSTYDISYTVSSYTSGNVRAACGTNRGAYVLSTGTYTERIIATGTDAGVIGSNFVGTIDNFSAKLVTY